MSRATPIEDYKLVDKTNDYDISFDTGKDREFKVIYRPQTVFVVVRETDYSGRVSSALTPYQAEAYATLLLYAAKLAREEGN